MNQGAGAKGETKKRTCTLAHTSQATRNPLPEIGWSSGDCLIRDLPNDTLIYLLKKPSVSYLIDYLNLDIPIGDFVQMFQCVRTK